MKTYSRKKQLPRYDFDDAAMDFNEICRLCLSDEGEKFPIFQDVNEVPLPLRIMACVSVEVFEGDGLPSQVCQQCIEELDSHYRFKQKCETSDARLKQYLKNMKTMHQFQSKLSQDLGLTKESELSDSTTTETLLTEQERQEQQIIQTIRDDLENHKQMNTNSSSIDEALSYKEKPTENDAGCSEAYIEPTYKQISNLTLAVKQERVEAEHSAMLEQRQANNQNMGMMTTFSAMKAGLPFVCTKCPKRFAKRIDLRRHESVHNQQRGFECPVCEKWFPNKTSFSRHERTHTGERPYACSQCDKSFSQGAILARHIMTHTGIKPFKCEVCSKGFTQREGLRVHMRQHTKEQPEIQLHECPLCEKSFCHPSGLSRHLIIHTGKTFDCTVCPKVFTDSSSLRRHMKRHGDASEPPLNHPPQDHNLT
ncbi:zinc finger protein Paris-like isoform X1 [Periplaneta americana]|uniref:zinc finger protein Paris-like isoform X1 n=1 Tax=Periplaneta americana TaxID=6978 RepID=UPI0037E790F5